MCQTSIHSPAFQSDFILISYTPFKSLSSQFFNEPLYICIRYCLRWSEVKMWKSPLLEISNFQCENMWAWQWIKDRVKCFLWTFFRCIVRRNRCTFREVIMSQIQMHNFLFLLVVEKLLTSSGANKVIFRLPISKVSRHLHNQIKELI